MYTSSRFVDSLICLKFLCKYVTYIMLCEKGDAKVRAVRCKSIRTARGNSGQFGSLLTVSHSDVATHILVERINEISSKYFQK
jgi:hypothetical protein